MHQDKKNIITDKSEDRDQLDRFLKITAVVIFIFGTFVIGLVKYNNPDWSWGWIWFSAVFLTVSCLILYFAFVLFDKISKSDTFSGVKVKVEPTGEVVLRDIVFNCMKNDKYYNMIEEIEEDGPVTVGELEKSHVYVAKCRVTYTENPEDRYYILINMHYPNRVPRIIKASQGKLDPGILNRAIESVGGVSESKLDSEDTSVFNPTTGALIQTKKLTHHSVKDNENSKGDFK